MGRFGGFRAGKRFILGGHTLVGARPVESIADLDYTKAQGIWNMQSTMQFPKSQAPAAIELVGTSSVFFGTLTCPEMVENDVLVYCAFNDNAQPSLPSAFTEIHSGNANTVGYAWGFKVMGATPDTSIDVSTSEAVFAFALRGVDTINPLDVTPPAVATGSLTGRPNPPMITTATDGAFVVAVGFLDDDNDDDADAPSGYTLIATDTATGTLVAAYRIMVTPGATDPAAFEGIGSDAWVGAIAAFRKAY